MTEFEYKRQGDFHFIKETTSDSIIADITSILLLLIGFYINYKFIGGNGFLDFIIFLLFVAKIITYIRYKVKKFPTKDGLIKYLLNN